MIGRAPKPTNEIARLEKLATYGVLDSGAEDTFDRITRLAARLFRVPIALISVVDEASGPFKSCFGLEVEDARHHEAFCAQMPLRDDVLALPDAAKDPRFARHPMVRGKPHIRFYAGAPLVTQDGVNLGSLSVIDRVSREVLAEEREALADLARLAIHALELRQLASVDPVTELPNRRFFDDLLARERKRALRSGRSLAVIVMGVDRFDDFIEEFGFATGDQILHSVTQHLRGQLRDSDLMVRYSAREFAILLPDTDENGTALVAEHLRNELELASFMTERGDFSVTASIGVAQCHPTVESLEDTLSRAVKRARSVMEKGGNRVAASDSGIGSRFEAG